MSERREMLDDAASRRLAWSEFARPVILEAGAGTGKTTALVSRLLAWLLHFGWNEAAALLAAAARERGKAGPEPRDVAIETLEGALAITFTDAAAANMSERLANDLATVAAGAPPASLAELSELLPTEEAASRARVLLEELGRIRIQTIHAFCRALLADHPLEAGLHPRFEVDADGDARARWIEEVLSVRVPERLAAGGEMLAFLLDDGDAASLDRILDAAIENGLRAEELQREPYSEAAIREATAAAREGLAPLRDALAAALAISAKALRVPVEIRDALDRLLADLDGARSAEILEAVAEEAASFLDARRSGLADWVRGTVQKGLAGNWTAREPIASLAAAALDALEALRSQRPLTLARARRVVAPLLDEVRSRLRREGTVAFEDLLVEAERLLEGDAAVRARVRRGIRQLLVDEFQDTDRRQCAILRRLALDGDPRPGLFVVGDPKQSIYGWRRADLAAYAAFLEEADRQGAARGALSMNFRSLPAILEEVDRVFAGAMRPRPGMQPAFAPLEPSPGNRARAATISGAAVEYWHSIASRDGRTTARAAAEAESRALVADIARRRAAEPALRLADFALLLRSTNDLEIYLDAFRDAGMLFSVERDRSYFRRREIQDVAAAVRLVLDPADSLALATFLRSPWVGVPDAALRPLWRQRVPEIVAGIGGADAGRLATLSDAIAAAARETPRDVPRIESLAGWDESLVAALQAIAVLRAVAGREPASRFVERFRALLLPEPVVAARYLGEFGLANLERFFRGLESELEESGDDPGSLLRYLRRAVAERLDEPEARPAEAASDAVQILTIHKAKGLEFRHVYLAQLHKESRRRDPSPLALARGGERLEYRLLGAATPGFARAARLDAERDAAERVRLLYVAMTRAKERLVLLGDLTDPAASRGDLLPILAPRIVDVRFAEAPPEPPEATDRHGVLWRAPALLADAGRTPTVGPSPIAAIDRASADRDLARLDAGRTGARLRAARPLGAAVTALDAAGRPREEVVAPAEPDSSPSGRKIGAAVHRVLAAADPARATGRDEIAESAGLSPSETEAARALLGRFARGALGRRFGEISSSILARECPIVLAADPASTAGPIGWISGAIDMLYRDPSSGEIVVADFKTDAAADEAAAARLSALYASQLRYYGEAVRRAFALERLPRLELWLLQADRVVELPPTFPPAAAGAPAVR